MLDKHKPIDVLIVNGDMLDGKGPASEGTELITSDVLNKQVVWAVKCIEYAKADTIMMTYGTRYHTGSEDPEKIISRDVDARQIGGHIWFDVNGVVFDCKHHISGASVPHTKSTAIARERLWNLLWAEHEEAPKSDIIIRSHRHAFDYCGSDNWLGVVTPALQGAGSKINRVVSGTVHFGIVFFDVRENGTYGWGWDIPRVESQKIRPTRL
jgi:hypothetical protein